MHMQIQIFSKSTMSWRNHNGNLKILKTEQKLKCYIETCVRSS